MSGTATLADQVAGWAPDPVEQYDVIVAKPVAGLSATLGHDRPVAQDGDELPVPWHWLSFLDWPARGDLGEDGHPRENDLFPLGHIDLAVQLGIDPQHAEAFDLTRSQLVLASAAAGLSAPVDGVTTDFRDPESVRRDTVRGRRLGMGGKLCIHPAQVAVVHAALAPTADEVAWARAVIGAGVRGAGAVDGHMVDAPVIAHARRIIEAASAEGKEPA